jgi:hypothetical protein
MEQTYSLEGSASEEIIRPLWNPNFRYRGFFYFPSNVTIHF